MAVVMRNGDVRRYDTDERLNHWAVAFLFILLAASGLAFFHPAFWFLGALLGGGNWARILHPFLGVLMFVLFSIMAFRYWDDNKIRPYDREWGKRLGDVISNRDADLPEIDKYNAGQKYLFWVMVATMTLLVISGIIMWRPYFAEAFHINVVRIAVVVHALCAFILILGIIAHVYAGVFWVVGSLRAMTRGTVSSGWARHHHPLWYRRVSGRK
ncbi:MAG: formate dehydrogenase subunit gamma [Burkholderiaceae bacterium]